MGAMGPPPGLSTVEADKGCWEAGQGQPLWRTEEGCPCPFEGLPALSKGPGTQLGSTPAFLCTHNSQGLARGINQLCRNLGGGAAIGPVYGWGDEVPEA